MGHSARVQISNSWARKLNVTVASKLMNVNIPARLDVPPAASTSYNVSTDWMPGQSWMRFILGESSTVKIGFPGDWFSSAIRELNGPQGQVASMIAPLISKDAAGYDSIVSILAGPGKLDGTLNSILHTNAESIVNLASEQVRALGGLASTVQIEMHELDCTFAAVSKQGQQTPWNMDLMLSFSGILSITPSIEKWFWKFPPTIKIPIKNLMVQCGVTIDTTNSHNSPQVPVIHLHRLQSSIDNLKIIQSIMKMLPKVLDLRPAVLNSTKNKEILANINDKLRDSLSELGDAAKLRPLETYSLSTIPESPQSLENYQEWMSKPSIQSKKLCHLKIPGTHDSAAYKFDPKISTVLYDELLVLDKLKNAKKAPHGHKLDDKANIYLGPQAYNDLTDNIALLAQAHDGSNTIKRQLEDGIRYLDLRIYGEVEKDDKGNEIRTEYYTQHLLRAPKLKDLIDQIREFLEEHSSSQEFIIVEFAQSRFDDQMVSWDSIAVADIVKKELGQWVYMPPDAPKYPEPGPRYNFQTLADTQLSSITKGGPKVLFVSRDGCLYPHSILNVHGPSLQISPTDEGDFPLFPWWFTKEPSNTDCVGYILLNTFDPSARLKILKHDAYKRNADVQDYLERTERPVWRYMMDWYTECKGADRAEKLPIDRIIKANG